MRSCLYQSLWETIGLEYLPQRYVCRSEKRCEGSSEESYVKMRMEGSRKIAGGRWPGEAEMVVEKIEKH